MGDRNFVEDVDFGNDNSFAMNQPMRPMRPPKRGMPNYDRYNNAYGNYRGGYGPGGGFGGFGGPPRGPGGPPPLVPRPPLRQMGPKDPHGPPPPMRFLGRGYGPGGPPQISRNIAPETQTFRFLLRCGLPKETIKDLPKNLLILLEAHHCGVCGLDFETFSISRIHYISRNHAKNQNKWLLQNADKQNFSKEMPLKARELYCELCDVKITSTAHADSHYSGKPHRAIVEGRKKPKNPFLLQKAMEGRIDQLIQREKQFLPAINVPKVTADGESKSAQSDLYCDICKTSMTCSEQMTMHLNGKRHLSKEKQHIIRVMNEQSQNTTNAVKEKTPAAGEQTEGNGNANGNANNNEDAEDWTNGSGTWED